MVVLVSTARVSYRGCYHERRIRSPLTTIKNTNYAVLVLPMNTIDERGHSYGRLRVLEYKGRSGDRHALWLCECACGRRVVAQGRKLRNGDVVSCGCWRADSLVRRAARLTIPPRRRRSLAALGASFSRKANQKSTTALSASLDTGS